MVQRWGSWDWRLGLASWLEIGGALALGGGFFFIATSGDCAIAQITSDGTLGAENSVVTPTNIDGLPTERIDGGATRGTNLFHSFEQFSVPTGSAAYFNNALNIHNIISRVTGSSISHIDGLLRANGTANLFLLNPNGIIFGPNATLNIGGSFVGSTASSINFADGTQFSGTAPQTTPLLTVSVPLGLQYGSNAGRVQVQGSDLQVQTGQTLALIGGDVSVEGGEFGFLSAPGGRIELGGLTGAGTVEIEGQQFDGAFGLRSLRFPDFVERADVSLTNYAFVDVAAGGGGGIAINARNLEVLGGSLLRAGIKSKLGSPTAQAGDITLNATEAIQVDDQSVIGNIVFPGTTGNAGDIRISTGSLSLTKGAQLDNSTFGQGNAGNVIIDASDKISLDGSNSTIFSIVDKDAKGRGGSINITTGSLSLTNGAQLDASTFGKGDSGSISIDARNTVLLDNTSPDGDRASTIYTEVVENAQGNGGNINITTGSLSLTNGAQLDARTEGRGNAGSITITARDTVSFDGTSADGGLRSAASSLVVEGAEGNGGNINITTGSLSVSNRALLDASTEGHGNASSVIISAREISFDNGVAFSRVDKGAVGTGGNVEITTGSLSVTNGSQLQAQTLGRGNAGSVIINARDTVSFDGVSNDGLYPSAAFSTVESGAEGKGGGVNISAGLLSVTNGALLSTSSAGSGAAGNIEVTARSIRLDNQALLSSDTVAGQGNIFLRSGNLVLRHGSNITTDATGEATGGNITIATGIIAALENSDITANAVEGRGGNVQISTQGLFLSLNSQITASSQRGIDGVVEINRSDIDPSQGLATLPAQLVEASRLIATGCAASGRQGKSKFIITGRDGFPFRPGDAHISHYPTGTVRSIPSSSPFSETPRTSVSSSDPATNPTSSEPTPIVEAQGWAINDKGEVVLTASANTATPHNPWMNPPTCRSSTFHQQPLALGTR